MRRGSMRTISCDVRGREDRGRDMPLNPEPGFYAETQMLGVRRESIVLEHGCS